MHCTSYVNMITNKMNFLLGLITAQDFKQALDNLGISFGTKAADKILVLMNFTPDGLIDYLKLGEEVEKFMRYLFNFTNLLIILILNYCYFCICFLLF